MAEQPRRLRVFLDVPDPWARRVMRDALARERDVRFVRTRGSADLVVTDTAIRRAPVAAVTSAAVDDMPTLDVPTDDSEVDPSARRSATRLTDREREVLQALAEGSSNAAIADRLGISRSTVKFHAHALFEKLGVRTRAEAVAAGVRRGEVLL